MTKNILIKDYQLLDEGYLEACDAVAQTFGAEGKLAVLQNPDINEPFILTKDGVTVIKHIKFGNVIKNFGAQMAIQACFRTYQQSGDSTTTTAIFMQGYPRLVSREKFNKSVERGVNIAIRETNSLLDKFAKKTTKKDLRKIAKVACNNDGELSTLVNEAFEYAGDKGLVEVLNNNEIDQTRLIKREGIYLEAHGYTDVHFINEESKQMAFDNENCYVICLATYDFKDELRLELNEVIKNFYLSEESKSAGRTKKTPLIVFIQNPNVQLTEYLIGLKSNGFNVCCVATNGYDDKAGENLLTDIGNMTGISIYNPRQADPQLQIGFADKIVVNLSSTSIIVNEVPEIIYETLANLEEQPVRDELRIKRLKTKAGIIEVGGINPSHQKETFDRVEDAVASIKTSKQEGFISGGGSALAHISSLLQINLLQDEQLGYDLVKKVLQEPLRRLLTNANRDEKFQNVLSVCESTYGMGYNAVTDEVCDLLKEGIIDSKKSIKVALESATTTSINFLNVGVIVAFPQEIEL